MSKRYYEAHITMLGSKEAIRPYVEATKWKFSAIDGDANFGDGVKVYATRQMNGRLTEQEAVNELNVTANILERFGIKVLRRKVEVVIYDDRSELVRPACNGGCAECHTEDLLEAGVLKPLVPA